MPGNHVGHGEGFAGTCHPQQRLEHEAIVQPLDQGVDGRRLVARRRIRPVKLKWTVRVFDETGCRGVHTRHAQGKLLLSHYYLGFPYPSYLIPFSFKMTSLFASVELAARDPILGLNEQYNADTRAGKVNLGVGVYYDDEGRLPLLQAVRKAEISRLDAAAARGYLPIEGIAGYNKGAQTLLFGADSPLMASGRVLTAQALGGTGALKIGADFLKQLLPAAKVVISNPSWENHRALFERAGFTVDTYPYYDAANHGLDFTGMLAGSASLARTNHCRSACLLP